MCRNVATSFVCEADLVLEPDAAVTQGGNLLGMDVQGNHGVLIYVNTAKSAVALTSFRSAE